MTFALGPEWGGALWPLLLGITALWMLLLVVGVLEARALPPLAPMAPPAQPPAAVAIVPARDEGHQIERCLKSLLAQDWPGLRVVCVDDRSTDGTYELAQAIAEADPRLTVVRGTRLPEGWLGKNHANAQGVQAAGPCELYLFTDADTVHAPHALPSAFAALERHRVGMLSILTNLELRTFWEKALLTNVIGSIASAFPVSLVNLPRAPVAIANGQFLLVRRAAYESVGGHAAIHDRVADDLELARLFKRGGHGLRVEDGRGLVSVRMYTNLPDIWAGFVKNGVAGSGGAVMALLGAVFLAGTLLPFAVLPWAVVREDWYLAALAFAGVLAAWGQRLFLFSRLFSVSPLYGLLVPVTQLMLAAILVQSALRRLTGRGPTWKGRTYPRAR